jgi:ABC-type glycerol-3-phosphate transport system substrate-binding protein
MHKPITAALAALVLAGAMAGPAAAASDGTSNTIQFSVAPPPHYVLQNTMVSG